MILFDLKPTEDDPAYQALQVSNLDRQYSFFRSIVQASIETGRLYLSQTVIKAFNYHAIVCLHADAGQYRPCAVEVGDHRPPAWFHVQSQMDDFVNQINRAWESMDPVALASFALWRVNWIHPFVNGNGRTARLVSYYILCLRAGGLLPGTMQLPELLRRDRHKPDDPYVASLKEADNGNFNPLHELVQMLLTEQLGSANQGAAANTPSTDG